MLIDQEDLLDILHAEEKNDPNMMRFEASNFILFWTLEQRPNYSTKRIICWNLECKGWLNTLEK
jgi:hypothetical protein